MEINDDGSMKGKTFSGDRYDGPRPQQREGDTYADYRDRVDKAVKLGFHLGDLSWSEWSDYCMGSGQYEGVDSNTRIS